MSVKRCVVCNRVSGQGFNGRYYCHEHHPQALCSGCGVHLRDGLAWGRRLCEPCEKRERDELRRRSGMVGG